MPVLRLRLIRMTVMTHFFADIHGERAQISSGYGLRDNAGQGHRVPSGPWTASLLLPASRMNMRDPQRAPPHLNRRDIFKQNRSAALAEWRQLAA